MAAVSYLSLLTAGPGGTRPDPLAGRGQPGRVGSLTAAVIARHLNMPVTPITPQEAEGHFGWMAPFALLDSPASSTLTQQQSGWKPDHPGLIADLDEGHYFTT